MENDTDNNKIKAFGDLLDSLKVTDKKKELWKEIYGHAIQDRSYALQMYVNCSNIVIGDPTQHAIHGPNIAKYLERMSRSNDQLLKLAELVAAAEEIGEGGLTMSTDEIYEKLSEAGPAVVPFDKKKKGR
jgi:flavorubredoxin